jgi:hypothetical protein
MQTVSILTPAQQEAARQILRAARPGCVAVLRSKPGRGRTAVLRYVHGVMGGVFLGLREVMDSLRSRQPSAVEEAFLGALDRAVASHDTVVVDDLHLVTDVVASGDDGRAFLLDAALTEVLADAAIRRKTLIFGVEDDAPWSIGRRAQSCEIGGLAAGV